MATIYGFSRPDGSVVVDTQSLHPNNARGDACLEENVAWNICANRGYTIQAFTLSPDGTISPRKE